MSLERKVRRVPLGDGCVDLAKWVDVEMLPSGLICTVAPWQLWVAEQDERYCATLHSSDLVVADGNGIILLLRLRGMRQERITGRELVERLADGRLWPDRKIVVVGASDKAREYASQHLGWAAIGGSFAPDKFDDSMLSVRRWLETQPDEPRVFVIALGCPTQERVGEILCSLDGGAVAIGVGGAVESVAGTVPAPPDWVLRYRLEFLYRAYRLPHLRTRVLQALSLEIRLVARGLRAKLLRH